jgi:putative ABC transport system permease protein
MNSWRDVRTGVRTLRKSPGYAATAILTLALGIGATTATFSFCDGLLWKPLPLPHLESLAMIVERVPESPAEWRSLTPADFDDITRQTSAFSSMAAWDDDAANLIVPGSPPERVVQVLTSANFFDVLGVAPAQGRAFAPGEDQRGREPVVILSHDLWQRRFSGDPAILGRPVHLNDKTYRVIGVMPPGFQFPKRAQLWTPLALEASDRASRTSSEFVAMGRLKPGMGESDASREIAAIGARLAQQFPATNQGRAFRVMGVQRFLLGEGRRQYLTLLFGAVLFVLLIACANVANLQFARAIGRMREVAVRTALGAGRGRLMAQLLTESVLLALAGGLLGLLLASWGLDTWRASLPADAEKNVLGLAAIALDHRALWFTLLAAVASGVLSGLAPAWQWSRPNLYDALKEGGHSVSAGRARHRLRAVLVAGEIALTVVLLVGAGLMIRGFRVLTRSGAELQPASLLTLRLAVTDAKYPEDYQLAAFYRQVLERIGAVPGVRAAAGATSTPYSDHFTMRPFAIEGRPPAPGHTPAARFQAVSADYFETMRVPLVAGRPIGERDNAEAPRVAVVSQRLAREWWPGGASPVGRRIRIGDAGRARPWVTIVGVVGDVMFSVFDRAPHATLYVPYLQSPRERMDIGIRTAGDPTRLIPSIAAAIHAVDPEQPVTEVRTVEAQIRDDAFGLTYVAALLGIFGVIGLVLSSIGVYGVMAYLVSEQTHEIGIRMALGAPRNRVMRAVFLRGFATTAAGLAIGVMTAYVLARLMASLIWGVSAGDPVTFTAIPVALAAAASLAIYIPAHRAMSIDPMAALRHE